MDIRLDPGCEGARALTRRHVDQVALLVAGSPGQLASVVQATQETQLREHLVSCARCRHYDPCCPLCGFDARRERHGWMCKAQLGRWRDVFPWNWRARQAPPRPAGVSWKHVHTPTPAAPRARTYEAPVLPAPHRGQPKPRPRPQAPQPSALALAYAALGLAPEASADAVRAAYRTRAQQYHPDKVGHMAPEFREVAERKMREINAAYERVKRATPGPK